MQLRSTATTRVVFLAIALAGSSAAQQAIVIQAGEPSTPSGRAIHVLESAVQQRGLAVRRAAQAGSGELLLRFATGAPGKPESFSIKKSPGRVEVRGSDESGLAYGAFELLGQFESAGWPSSLAQAAVDTTHSPDVKLRSLAMSLFNRDLEREWFYSKEFWESYFELLARSRFNQFTLIYGHQTSYFAPPFPFMIDVPGYERLKTPEYSTEDRRRNLEALRMITEVADEWGVQFVFGIWLEHAHTYGPNLVEGLTYEDLFDYCPKALAVLLRECPRIKGVQFRANSESGILEDDQDRFFTAIARSIQSVGRPIWSDFRAKGLRAETVASFSKLGMRPTVSTKFWREHMGLPFHGTRIDPSDKERSYRRYGYWDLLPHDRPYEVMYELWSFGSQKILLWGGLDYTRQFAASTHLGDADGYETFAPLSQKGFGNYKGGPWHIFADKSREHYRWEFERYWAYYLSFGLGTYAPAGSQPILDAEFRRHFGPAAPAVRKAYEAGSWIIPFITAVRNPASSNFRYWPEMDTGGLTDRYIQLDTGDNNLFYRVDDYVEDYLARRDSARLTPTEIASRLDRWAEAVQTAVEQAEPLLPASMDPKEFTATKLDFSVLSALARYHSHRLRSAQDYRFFVRSGERFYLVNAIEQYRKAVAQWTAISKATDGVYYDHMVFNRPPDQVGHWKDELPFLRADLARLEQIDKFYSDTIESPEAAASWKVQAPVVKMAMKWKNSDGVLIRWADTAATPDKPEGQPDVYSMQNPQFVVKKLLSDLRYAKIVHVSQRAAAAGHPIQIHASLLDKRKGFAVTLYYRISGKGFTFTPLRMTESQPNIYHAEIPAAKSGETVFYYIDAVAHTSFYSGSAKEPYAIAIGEGRRPVIRHEDIASAKVGTTVKVRASVETVLPPSSVRLYYRHLDQSEDWHIVDMKNTGGAGYEAVIPAEFVVPGWDLSYTFEAVDTSGTGAFYPNSDTRQPMVVIRVH